MRHMRHPALLLVVEITAAQLTVCLLGAGPGAVFTGGPVLLSFCYCPVRWHHLADWRLQLSRKTELPGASAGRWQRQGSGSKS